VSQDKEKLIYGIHGVRSALNMAGTVSSLWIDRSRKDNRIQELIELARKQGVKPDFVDKKKIEAVCNGNHQGVVAWGKATSVKNETFLEDLLINCHHAPLLLVLDGVQDPHNLGACLRTANAVGADAVIIPKDRSVGLTPVVSKVACGADSITPLIQVTNLARTLELIKSCGVTVLGLAGEAEANLYESELTGALALVLGAEGKGMRRLTREKCDALLKIPMPGQVESLNVSVAAGVCLYEVLRQRTFIKRAVAEKNK